MAKSLKDLNEFLQEKLREFKDQCYDKGVDPYQFMIEDLTYFHGYEVYERSVDGKFKKRVG